MIYLDSAATTMPSVEALENYRYAAQKYPFNPSSTYKGGQEVRECLEKCRSRIARVLDCKPNEIIFTSGGTEGNNLVIQGFFENLDRPGVLITSQIEHPSVLKIAQALYQKDNVNVYLLPVDQYGSVDINDIVSCIEYEIKNGIKPEDILVSIQAANNEIGTQQDNFDIFDITKKYGCFFHSDQVQLYPHYGHCMSSDAFTVSGHKFGALRGTGFVYVSEKIQKHLSPTYFGGGQEFGLRSGTENLAGIYALTCQVIWLETYLMTRSHNIYYKIHLFKMKIAETFANNKIKFRINGLNDIPILSVTFPGVEASSLVSLLSEKDIYISAGSACHSYSPEPSHVLKAIGLSDEDALSTVRICWNEDLTDEQVEEFLKWLVFYIRLLRGE